MDLGTIQDLLNDFATFGKNIDNALQGVPGLLTSLVAFVDGGAEAGAETTSSLLGSSEN